MARLTHLLALSSALGLAAPTARADLAASPSPLPSLALAPAPVRPGDAFLLSVRGTAEASGEVLGVPLLFYPVAGGVQAVAALPIEAEAGRLPIRVTAGATAVDGVLEVLPADFPERRLRVASRFVKKPTPAVKRRIAADREAFAQAHDQPPAPPLFAGRFAWPRQDAVNAAFGESRVFNGKKTSRHYGLDIGGGLGAPVAAAQAGRVVLVRDCWASGLSVVVFHGAGLFSSYFHLSRALVSEGEVVARGQPIGAVGRSGRVTGPHLHWGVKVGELYVDPESVLRLPFE